MKTEKEPLVDNEAMELQMREDIVAKIAPRKTLHLATTGRRTGKRHTVEVWFAAGKDKLYLSHEGTETDWMKNIKKSSKVTIQIGDQELEGKATYLQDGTDESWSGKVALYEKYYGKATREVIEDWFSLSKLIMVKF